MLLLRRLRPLLVVLLLVFLVSPGALAHAAAAAAAVGDQPHRRHQEQQDIITFDAPGLGRVRGRRVRLPSGQVGAELLGLAYANRPVQRFKSATVWDTPSGQEEWDASSPRPPCPQMVDGEVVGSEDCLFLNIFLPPAAIAAAANASSPSLPVYVFAHGGSFILGSPSSPGIDGAAFAADRSVVVVTLAYRLGALGFLAHPAMNPEGAQGNLGLLDLRVGLEWVQRYIRHFGGDPGRVTLGGQSAGAYLACLLLAMPETGQKPFHAVIMESGGCYAQPLALAQNRSRAWAEEVGCAFSNGDPAASLACLERLPLEAVVPLSTHRGAEQYHFWQPTVVSGLMPLPASPTELLRGDASLRRSVAMIAGTNEDEGTLFLPPTGLLEDDSDAAYLAWVTGGAMQRGQGFPFLTAEDAQRVLQLYPPAGAGRNRWNAAAIIADAHYKCPTRFLARSTGGWRSLHLYRFAYYQQACDPSPPLHCYHGSELPYLFGHPRQAPCHRPRFTLSEQVLSNAVRGLWTNLIHSGRGPNADIDDGDSSIAAATGRLRMLRGQTHKSEEALERVFWPAFREGQDERMLRFDARNITLVPLDQHEAEACDFWDTTRVYR